MAKMIRKSVLPIYAVGALWLCWAFFFDLYRLNHFLLAAAASIAVYLLARQVWKDQLYEVPDPAPAPVSTGNAALDALISERDKALSEMRRLNESIHDDTISAQIEALETTTKKITDYVVDHPEKLPQIRKFMSYYLPTTLKLLNSYDRMGAAGVEGENISGTMEKIESIMQTIVTAFHRQFDALFGDEALDISTDITVIENLLAREGLGGTQLGADQ